MKRYSLLMNVLLMFCTTVSANSLVGESAHMLTGLLNGGNSALAAKTMGNAAGMMEYCAKNKLLAQTGLDDLKGKLTSKLGINKKPTPDYKNGLLGIITTKDGKMIDLNKLGDSPLTKKVKQKACDLALSQAKAFI